MLLLKYCVESLCCSNSIKKISKKTFNELDKQIKQLICCFKVSQVEERLENIENDFE